MESPTVVRFPDLRAALRGWSHDPARQYFQSTFGRETFPETSELQHLEIQPREGSHNQAVVQDRGR